MKITCTGPNGERFEGEASLLIARNEHANHAVSDHNEKERSAVYAALSEWCKTVKANPRSAHETE